MKIWYGVYQIPKYCTLGLFTVALLLVVLVLVVWGCEYAAGVGDSESDSLAESPATQAAGAGATSSLRSFLLSTTSSTTSIVCTTSSVSVYSISYKMKKAYQCSLKCGTLGGRCGYIVERELSTMSTHPLDKESIQ